MYKKYESLIRLPEVLKRTGVSRAGLYRMINKKRFPLPVKISERAIAFVESEVNEWIESVINMSRNHVA